MIASARSVSLALLPLLLLAACDGGEGTFAESASYDMAAAAPPPPPPAPMADSVAVTASRLSAAEGEQAAGGGGAPGADGEPVQAEGMLLAYSYAVGFEAPMRNVAPLKDRHEAECRAAGPSLCLVLGGSVNGDGQTYMYGNLSLRAEPRWLEGFRGGLAQDAAEADGRIASTSTSTEDLTRSIVDTEARLEAQETLRDRLLVLTQQPTDELDDLLAAERELARVQGEIDSARSQLAVMRARVNMSTLDLSYSGITPAVSSGAFEPVTDALRNFVSVFAGSLGGVITIIAAAIPVVVILIPLVIVVWRLFRGWRRRRRSGSPA